METYELENVMKDHCQAKHREVQEAERPCRECREEVMSKVRKKLPIRLTDHTLS